MKQNFKKFSFKILLLYISKMSQVLNHFVILFIIFSISFQLQTCFSDCNSQEIKSNFDSFKLVEYLNQEINYIDLDFANYNASINFMKSQGFEYQFNNYSTFLKITKYFDKHFVAIICDSNISIRFMSMNKLEEEHLKNILLKILNHNLDNKTNNDETDELEEQNNSIFDFKILIKVNNRKEGLIFQCTFIAFQVEIEQIEICDDIDEYLKENITAGRCQRDHKYTPEFSQFLDLLQQEFHSYLEAFGIDSEFIYNVQLLSQYHEIMLHINWINQVKSLFQ